MTIAKFMSTQPNCAGSSSGSSDRVHQVKPQMQILPPTIGRPVFNLKVSSRLSPISNEPSYAKKLIERSNSRRPATKLKEVSRVDFQDEFMSHYEEFSQSWRDQINRQKRF